MKRHAIRLKNPAGFDPKSFRQTKGGMIYGSVRIPETITIIWAKPSSANKPADPPIPQSLQFPTDKWSAADAKKWLRESKIKNMGFEQATDKAKEELPHIQEANNSIESAFWLHFIEAKDKDKKGMEWDVVLIEEGLSLNGVEYPFEVLKTAAPLFEGVNAYALLDKANSGEFEHLPDELAEFSGKIVSNLAGWFTNVRAGEIPGRKGVRGLMARFHFYKDFKWLAEKIKDAWKRGKQNILGFSIDAWGDIKKTARKMPDGRPIKKANSLDQIMTVDVVSHPAAGGDFLRLAASTQFEVFNTNERSMSMDFKKLLLRLIEGIDKAVLEGKDVEKMTEANAIELLTEVEAAMEADDIKTSQLKATLKTLLSMIPTEKRKDAKAAIEALLSGKTAEAEKLLSPEPEKKPDLKVDETIKPKETPSGDEKVSLAKVEEMINAKVKSLETENTSLREATALMNSQAVLTTRLAESKLPDPVKSSIREEFLNKPFKTDDLDGAFKRNEDMLSKLTEAGIVTGLGNDPIFAQDFARERMTMGLIGYLRDGFGQKFRDYYGDKVPDEMVEPFTSLRQAFRYIARVQGEVHPKEILRETTFYLPDFVERKSYWEPKEERMYEGYRRLYESLKTSSWGQILGDAINKVMMAEYAESDLNIWQQIVSTWSNLSNYQSQKRMQLGGYGVMSIVPEGDAYPEATDPGDDQVTYSPAKRGRLQSLTEEMIFNDDQGAVGLIPKRMARSANLTIYRHIFDRFVANADAIASSGRGNLQTSSYALNAANLTLVETAMMGQTAYGNDSDYLGESNMPMFMIVPRALRETAHKLANADAYVNPLGTVETVSEFASTNPNIHKGKKYIVPAYWTDADDWWAIADPKKIPTIEVGFVDGKREPELFIQDQANVGSVFTADKITYKSKFVFGSVTLDWRAFHAYIT